MGKPIKNLDDILFSMKENLGNYDSKEHWVFLGYATPTKPRIREKKTL